MPPTHGMQCRKKKKKHTISCYACYINNNLFNALQVAEVSENRVNMPANVMSTEGYLGGSNLLKASKQLVGLENSRTLATLLREFF